MRKDMPGKVNMDGKISRYRAECVYLFTQNDVVSVADRSRRKQNTGKQGLSKEW